MVLHRNKQALLAELLPKALPSTVPDSKAALDFVSTGVGCFAFTLLQRSGVLNLLIEKGVFSEVDLDNQKKFKRPIAIKAALLSLCLCKALIKHDNQYYLSSFGQQLANHIGLITMVFEGYGELMAKGALIASDKIADPEKCLNGESIALSSIQFGEKAVDPLVIDVVKKLKLKGTICDLGCGSADRLLKLCKATSLPGLGLDANSEAVKIAKKLTESNPSISIQKADAANLDGIWEDVQVLMQCFMTHDIFPDEQFVRSLSSYRKNFPNMKYFIVIDIVAPEEDLASHMPGYDYVHGLLGIETRKHARFASLFAKSGYKIHEEFPIGMPNTYLWVLSPHI